MGTGRGEVPFECKKRAEVGAEGGAEARVGRRQGCGEDDEEFFDLFFVVLLVATLEEAAPDWRKRWVKRRSKYLRPVMGILRVIGSKSDNECRGFAGRLSFDPPVES